MQEELYKFHQDNQFTHWWFTGRNEVIDSVLKKELKSTDNTIIDIGAGFGACIPVLKKYGSVDAIEPWDKAHPELRRLGVREIIPINNFPDTYPEKTYNIVSFFDVIEHIEDDYKTLKVVHDKLLTKNGKCIITVPAYQWMWSEHDVKNKHFRRYSKTTLKKVLTDAGFKNIKISYFVTTLFPLSVLDRFVIKSKHKESTSGNGLLNFFLKFLLKIEASLIPFIRLPFGLSLIAIADADTK